MSGCETTSLKYPDGSDLMSYDGCPVETIVYFCSNCEWMATQNTCTDEMLPPCLLDAFPYLLEATNGGYSPHRTVASSDGGDCENQDESSKGDCGSGSSADCSGGECCTGDCGAECACENCDCECCEEAEPEAPSCVCQMPACTGGDDPNCATPFTSCMY